MKTKAATQNLQNKQSLSQKETITLFKKEIPTFYLMIILLIIGVFVRIWQLGIVPGGLNQDEAFGGYEAYSLLHYGMDSSGNPFPVYLATWGSGMSALNSYLMMPLMAIFGAKVWVVRFPQMAVACFSLYVFYKLLQKLFNTKTALAGLFLLVICPWHIMMARWGLDCNLAPGFLLFGLYFFVLGMDKTKYFMLSALFYGLSLYCYATIWPIVPLLLLLQAGYFLYVKKLRFNLDMFISVLILAFFALPLLLFLLVNSGVINEIRTSFFSIPKMPFMRSSEISFTNIPENFKNLWTIITNQNDGLYWNSTSEYGLYYKGTLCAAALGFAYCVKQTIKSFKCRSFEGEVIVLIQFLVSVLLGCLISVNVNRITCIHLNILMLAAIGLTSLLRLLKSDFHYASYVIVTAYSIVFLMFEIFYFHDYNDNIGVIFQDGLEESVNYAMDLLNEEGRDTVYVSSEFSYSKILFFSQLSVEEYVNTVNYSNYPAAFLDVNSAGPFVFNISSFEANGVYIINAENASSYESAGYTVKVFKETAVACY